MITGRLMKLVRLIFTDPSVLICRVRVSCVLLSFEVAIHGAAVTGQYRLRRSRAAAGVCSAQGAGLLSTRLLNLRSSGASTHELTLVQTGHRRRQHLFST